MTGPISIERRLALLEQLGEARDEISKPSETSPRDIARAICSILREFDPDHSTAEEVMTAQEIAALLLEAGLSSGEMTPGIRSYFRSILEIEVVPIDNVIELRP